ncbi:MAG TPA: TonB-dependent receptor [Terriglobales bacterium]|nr:TonB-dependent receptor [Terriglobales bacterium]
MSFNRRPKRDKSACCGMRSVTPLAPALCLVLAVSPAVMAANGSSPASTDDPSTAAENAQSALSPAALEPATLRRSKSGKDSKDPAYTQVAKLEQIVITALRRSQKLQDVPAAVSVFNQSSIDNLNLSGIDSLSRNVPSLSFVSSGTSEPILSIRGVTSTFSVAPAVSVYLNDTPLDFRTDVVSGSSLIDLFDVDRIEVLRGPQGTLYGASSLGGLIRIVTAKPNPDHLSGVGEVGYWNNQGHGSASSYEEKGAINLPLLKHVLAVRLVATQEHDGGFIDRVQPTDFLNAAPIPVSQHNANPVVATSGRIEIGWFPTDTLTVSPSYIYQDRSGEGTSQFQTLRGAYLLPELDNQAASYRLSIGNLTIQKRFPAFDLESSTSYAAKHTRIAFDYGEVDELIFESFGLGSVAIPGILDTPVNYREFTQELRLTSPGNGVVRWLAGAFFENQGERSMESWNTTAFVPLVGATDVFNYDEPIDDRLFAIYGDVTYEMTKRLELTGGLRYYDLNDSVTITQTGAFAGVSLPNTKSSSVGFIPMVTAKYRIGEETAVYASYTEGFRPGQGNDGLFSLPACTYIDAYKPIIKPDTSRNYELGAKSTFLDKRLAMNVSAFDFKWRDFQGVVISNCGQFIANAGDAEDRGVEIEGTGSISDSLSFGASFAYNDARVKSVLPPLQSAGVGMTGQRLPATPELKYGLNGQYQVLLKGGKSVYLNANWQHVGATPWNLASPTPTFTSPAYNNVDITLGLRANSWELSLFSRNVTNDIQIQTIGPGALGDVFDTIGHPRTIGVRFRTWYQ